MMNDDEVETSEPHDHVGLGDASLPDQFRSDRSGTPSRNKLYIFVHQTLLPRNHFMSRSLMAERCWRGREVRIGAHNSTGRPCSQQASQSPIPNHMDCSHVVQHKTFTVSNTVAYAGACVCKYKRRAPRPRHHGL